MAPRMIYFCKWHNGVNSLGSQYQTGNGIGPGRGPGAGIPRAQVIGLLIQTRSGKGGTNKEEGR